MHYSIIVCYNPKLDSLKKLYENLILQNSKVILIDNSEEPIKIKGLHSYNNNLKLITLGCNRGIAYAQNVGVKKAIELNSKYISFFDQDSVITNNFINSLIDIAQNNNYKIVAPLSRDSITNEILPSVSLGSSGLPHTVNYFYNALPYPVDIVISSGTTVLTKVFDCVGFFDESLFIDHVDTEWCLRCKNKNLKIFIIPSVEMIHSIGSRRKKISSFTVQVHSAERCYYQIRNSLLLLRSKHIPIFFSIHEILATGFSRFLLLFVVDNKLTYLKSYCKGITDGLFGNDGPKSH